MDEPRQFGHLRNGIIGRHSVDPHKNVDHLRQIDSSHTHGAFVQETGDDLATRLTEHEVDDRPGVEHYRVR